jgi:hypothetical protein
VLLAAFGILMGLALAPLLATYASMDPQGLWQAGGTTALFIAPVHFLPRRIAMNRQLTSG